MPSWSKARASPIQRSWNWTFTTIAGRQLSCHDSSNERETACSARQHNTRRHTFYIFLIIVQEFGCFEQRIMYSCSPAMNKERREIRVIWIRKFTEYKASTRRMMMKILFWCWPASLAASWGFSTFFVSLFFVDSPMSPSSRTVSCTVLLLNKSPTGIYHGARPKWMKISLGIPAGYSSSSPLAHWEMFSLFPFFPLFTL